MAKSVPPGSTPAWALAAALLWLCLMCSETNQNISQQALPQTKAGDVPCGKTGVTGKMFGRNEENVPQVKWPWQASLLYRNAYTCGAALIDNAWVVTAANCLKKSLMPSDYKILIGYQKLQEPSSYSRLMKVIKIVTHNNYNKNTYLANDIALLQMEMSLSLSAHIFPACLPTPSLPVNTRSNCWITGWGTRTGQWNLAAPYEIQEARVAVFERRFCEINVHVPVATTTIDHNLVLCVADLKYGNSICKGDHGGPLVCSIGDTWYLMGVSSWGLECKEPTGISYFTKISTFVPWVNKSRSAVPVPPAEDPAQAKGGPPMVNFTISSQRSSQKAKTSTMILLLFLLLLL